MDLSASTASIKSRASVWWRFLLHQAKKAPNTISTTPNLIQLPPATSMPMPMSAAIAAATYREPRRLGEATRRAKSVTRSFSYWYSLRYRMPSSAAACSSSATSTWSAASEGTRLLSASAMLFGLLSRRARRTGYYGMQYAVRPHGRRGNKTQYTRGSTHGIVVPKVSPAHL